jgi:hypothetical protein
MSESKKKLLFSVYEKNIGCSYLHLFIEFMLFV